jgi:hypothetical protein
MYTNSLQNSPKSTWTPTAPNAKSPTTAYASTWAHTPSDKASFSQEGLDLLQQMNTNKSQGHQGEFTGNRSIKDISNQTKEMLIKALEKAKENNPEGAAWIDPMLYAVSEDTKVAEVPEYWNSENTSQRIVDFAMSFREVEGGDYEEYLKQAKEAVLKGFKLAKEDLGELPGPSAKLFNDTYKSVMEKFDQLLEDYKSGQNGSAPEVRTSPKLDLVA